MDYLLKNQNIKALTCSRLIDYMTRRPTHFVTRMALANSVVNLCSADFNKISKPGVVVEEGWKTKCYYRLPFSRYKIVNKVNEMEYARFLRRNIKEDDIIWAYEPFTIDAYNTCKRKILIYEMCDDTSAYFKTDKNKYNNVLRQEEKICRTADVVITISEHLRERKKHLNPNFYLVRNGADYQFFREAYDLKKTIKDELSSINSPIVGYHGAISPWIDFDLIKETACHLEKFNFVFVGRINKLCHSKIRDLSRLPNVYFLGEKRYSDLIHYVKYFDVTIIPFVIDQLILSVNPIKIYEYLAAGKPVVSTPLPEVRRLEEEGVVVTTSSSRDFAFKIQKLFESRNGSELVKRRMELAFNNSWDIRYKELEELVYRVLVAKDLI